MGGTVIFIFRGHCNKMPQSGRPQISEVCHPFPGGQRSEIREPTDQCLQENLPGLWCPSMVFLGLWTHPSTSVCIFTGPSFPCVYLCLLIRTLVTGFKTHPKFGQPLSPES